MKPLRLWNLLDMLRFYAASFVCAWNNLQIMETQIVASGISGAYGSDPADWRDLQEKLRAALEELARASKELPLSTAMQMQIQRASKSVCVGSDPENHATLARLTEIRQNLGVELAEHYFLVIPKGRKHYYFNDGARLPQKVCDAFPEATEEIKSAHRCFALDEWTACVFHLMRALEVSLHKWATELGVTKFSAIELENWRNILDAADSKIKAIAALPKSSTRDAEMKYYGETSAHFRSIKDAWRNHVAHARVTYDEGQALSTLNHVSEFMRLLADRP